MKWIRKAAMIIFCAGGLFVGMTIHSTFLQGNYYQTIMISLSAVAAVITIYFSGNLRRSGNNVEEGKKTNDTSYAKDGKGN
jgi:hypothetical protein